MPWNVCFARGLHVKQDIWIVGTATLLAPVCCASWYRTWRSVFENGMQRRTNVLPLVPRSPYPIKSGHAKHCEAAMRAMSLILEILQTTQSLSPFVALSFVLAGAFTFLVRSALWPFEAKYRMVLSHGWASFHGRGRACRSTGMEVGVTKAGSAWIEDVVAGGCGGGGGVGGLLAGKLSCQLRVSLQLCSIVRCRSWGLSDSETLFMEVSTDNEDPDRLDARSISCRCLAQAIVSILKASKLRASICTLSTLQDYFKPSVGE